MREIKFRAWNRQLEVMVNEAIDMGKHGVFAPTMQQSDVKARGDVYEIMQYTGLTDKNGVEIYEGDICHYYDSEPDDQEAFDAGRWPDTEYEGGWHDVELTGLIEWQSKTAGFTVGGTKWWSKKLEVIGNIYENPQLLEEGIDN